MPAPELLSGAGKTESLLGWGQETVELGLAEKQTGMTCVGSQSGFSGAKRWEEREPEAAAKLKELSESHAQQVQHLRPALRSLV